MEETPEQRGENAAEHPSDDMNNALDNLNDAIKKQERATTSKEKADARNEARAAAEKWLEAFGEHAGLNADQIKDLKEIPGKIDNFKDLMDAIGSAAETDLGASEDTKAANARLRGAIKGALEQVNKAVSNILDSRRSAWQKMFRIKSEAMKKFEESSAEFEPFANDYAEKTKDLYDANHDLKEAGTTPTDEQKKAVNDAEKAFKASEKKYKEAQEKHGKAIDEAFPDGSDAKKKIEAQGGGKWRSFRALLLNWKLWLALAGLGGSLGIYFILKKLADDMTGCYRYIGTSSSQLASCHGLEDEGLEAACVCGTLSDAKTGGAKDSGTCCDGGGSSADCGGQVYCAKATCKKCSNTECKDVAGDVAGACGCAPGPPCNSADLQHAIQYTYTKYTAGDALAGIFDHGAGDWEHVGDEVIGVVKDILIIVVIVAGIALLIWVVAKVVNHIRNKKGGNEGGKAHDNVVIVQEPAARRRRRSRRKN